MRLTKVPCPPCHLAPYLPLQVMSLGAMQCSTDRVVASLHSLFCAFAEEQQQQQQAGPLTGTAARAGMVDASTLRHSLSMLRGQQCRVGECPACPTTESARAEHKWQPAWWATQAIHRLSCPVPCPPALQAR